MDSHSLNAPEGRDDGSMRDSDRTPHPPQGWQPHYPDPAVADGHRPGLHEHQHQPNRLHTWVFEQHQVWVDYYGNEVEIESMSRDYTAAVIAFCHRQAVRIRGLVVFDRCLALGELALTGTLDECVIDEIEAEAASDPHAWLEETPLVRALRRRLEPTR